MDIEKLARQLDQMNQHPPVEKWDPPFCGDMDIVIKADGVWWYMGSPIKRLPLVKLLASVLTTAEGECFLITPIEKVRIKVEDAAFIATQWRVEETQAGKTVVFTTNVGDEFILSEQHDLALGSDSQPGPVYLNVHRGLQARLHRNVYYQLAETARIEVIDGVSRWVVQSGDSTFCLGVDE